MRVTHVWRILLGVALVLSLARADAAGGDGRLADAAMRRDVAALRALLGQKADVNGAQADGARALHWAAHWGDATTADLLIRNGADVNATNDLGVTPLALACVNGSGPLVERFLKAGANPNGQQLNNGTALMTAARAGDAAIVTTLIDHGALVNAKGARGETALMWAISEGHAEVVRVLLEHGADVKARTTSTSKSRPDGFTPLLFAARTGDIEAARLLLAAGADVNDVAGISTVDATVNPSVVREASVSGLLLATIRGHAQLAMLLLERGADANFDGMGYTALHWAAGSWETSLSGPKGIKAQPGHEWAALAGVPTGKVDLVKALLAHGANPNARVVKAPSPVGFTRARPPQDLPRNDEGLERPGATPFLLAAHAADIESMRVLAAAGADTRLPTNDRTTPLMVASGFGRIDGETWVTEERALEAVTLALELGADVNAANDDGYTALHGAAQARANAIVRLLIENGAAINPTNVYGSTPLTLAEYLPQYAGIGIVEHSETGDLLRTLGGLPGEVPPSPSHGITGTFFERKPLSQKK